MVTMVVASRRTVAVMFGDTGMTPLMTSMQVVTPTLVRAGNVRLAAITGDWVKVAVVVAGAGRIGTAVMAQLSVPTDHDIVTEAAPASVLPVPVMPSLPPPFSISQRDVWPAPAEAERASSSAIVSKTSCPEAEVTLTVAVLLEPVFDAGVPRGVV